MATRYTIPELVQLWVQAGGSAIYAPVAAAIAMAESGGNPDSVNTSNSNGTVDRGLWQINSIHGTQSTLDPLANARAAVGISKGGTDWRPWCVAWSNGRCGGTFLGTGAPVLKYMPQGSVPTGTTPTNGNSAPIVTTPVSTPGPLGPLFDILGRVFLGPDAIANQLNQLDPFNLGNGIRKFAYHSFLVAGGFVVMLFGIILVVGSTRTVRGTVRNQLMGAGPDVVVVPAATPGPAGPPGRPGLDFSAPPVSAPPATESSADLPSAGPFSAPPAPKKATYKPRHQLRVSASSNVAAVKGKHKLDPDELPPTPGYKGKRGAKP